jgi:nicotinamide mononucleotide transporter
MWLLAKRKVENWLLLNISNAVAIPLLFYKDLPLYAALTIFLFIVAVQGYFKWKKLVKKQPRLVSPPTDNNSPPRLVSSPTGNN